MKNTFVKSIINSKKLFQNAFYYLSSILHEPSDKLQRDAYEFWNKSSTENNIEELSHYEGHGRWSDTDTWNRIGDKHIIMFKQFCRYLNYDKPIYNILEWGPGGGANAIHFAKDAEIYYGVDISQNNLDECESQLKKMGLNNFTAININIENPENVKSQVNDSIDLFLSTAVYQHFPSKEYGLTITELAYDIISDEGLAIIQTRYDDNSNRFRPKGYKYSKNAIYFTSYKIDEFWKITEKIGFNPMYITLIPEVNYAYYFLIKKNDN